MTRTPRATSRGRRPRRKKKVTQAQALPCLLLAAQSGTRLLLISFAGPGQSEEEEGEVALVVQTRPIRKAVCFSLEIFLFLVEQGWVTPAQPQGDGLATSLVTLAGLKLARSLQEQRQQFYQAEFEIARQLLDPETAA